MKKELTVFLISIFLSCFLFVNISFARLYVKPAKQGIVRVKIFSLIPAVVTKNFDVGNFYNSPIDIVLEPTGSVSGLIGITESSFTLQPNETRNVEYVVTVSKTGVYYGGILVNVNPQNNRPTVAYQSDLTVIATESMTKPQLYVIITLVIILIIIIVYFKTMRSRK